MKNVYILVFRQKVVIGSANSKYVSYNKKKLRYISIQFISYLKNNLQELSNLINRG